MSHSSRAIELGLPLVRAALTGVSAVIDATGEVLGTVPLDTAGVLRVDVPLRRLNPPFRSMGPVLIGIATLWLVALFFLVARERRRELLAGRGVSPPGGGAPAGRAPAGETTEEKAQGDVGHREGRRRRGGSR
jgi:hypothetical protein